MPAVPNPLALSTRSARSLTHQILRIQRDSAEAVANDPSSEGLAKTFTHDADRVASLLKSNPMTTLEAEAPKSDELAALITGSLRTEVQRLADQLQKSAGVLENPVMREATLNELTHVNYAFTTALFTASRLSNHLEVTLGQGRSDLGAVR